MTVSRFAFPMVRPMALPAEPFDSSEVRVIRMVTLWVRRSALLACVSDRNESAQNVDPRRRAALRTTSLLVRQFRPSRALRPHVRGVTRSAPSVRGSLLADAAASAESVEPVRACRSRLPLRHVIERGWARSRSTWPPCAVSDALPVSIDPRLPAGHVFRAEPSRHVNRGCNERAGHVRCTPGAAEAP